MAPKRVPLFGGLLFALALVESGVTAEDWPMWRCNAQRTAATNGTLPDELDVLWQKDLQARNQAWDDPLNLDLMSYDRVFEPGVVDGIGCRNSVVWTFLQHLFADVHGFW